MAKTNSLILFATELGAHEAAALAEVTLDDTWIIRRRSILPLGTTTTDAPLRVWGTYVVVCDSVAQLRLIMPVLRYAGRAREIKVVVAATDRGNHFAAPAALPQNRVGSVSIKSCGVGKRGIVAAYAGNTEVEIRLVLASLTSGTYQTAPALPAAGLRIGVTGVTTLPWAVGDPWAGLVDDQLLQLEPDDIYPVDVIVGDIAATPDDPYFPVTVGTRGIDPAEEEFSWSSVMGAGGGELVERLESLHYSSVLPPVDTQVISPTGFKPYPAKGTAKLVLAGNDRLEIRDGQRVLRTMDRRVGFTENDVAVLRDHSALDFDQLAPSGPVEAARLLSQLAVAGIPARTGPLHPAVRSLLGTGVADAFEGFPDQMEPLDRESGSISLRRDALDRFGGPLYWRSVPAVRALTTGSNDTVSVLLTTKRPAQVGFALAQMERQTWPDLEVVLGLHGFGATEPGVQEAIAQFSRPIQVLELPGDLLFGAALNRVSHAASGTVVTKVDDDDWYGENHLRDLMQARYYSGATMVGCQVEFVYLEFLDITTRRRPMGEMFHHHIAGGSMTLSKEDLLAVGGWRPVRRAVDRCLLQGVSAKGGSIYRMHGQGYLLQRRSGGAEAGHTWNPEEASFIRNEFDQFTGFVPPPQISGFAESGDAVREARFVSHFENLRRAGTVEGAKLR